MHMSNTVGINYILTTPYTSNVATVEDKVCNGIICDRIWQRLKYLGGVYCM